MSEKRSSTRAITTCGASGVRARAPTLARLELSLCGWLGVGSPTENWSAPLSALLHWPWPVRRQARPLIVSPVSPKFQTSNRYDSPIRASARNCRRSTMLRQNYNRNSMQSYGRRGFTVCSAKLREEKRRAKKRQREEERKREDIDDDAPARRAGRLGNA